MYSAITSNKRRTIILITIFIAIILGLGYLYDYLYGAGQGGIIFALVISLVMALVGYYSGDKMALLVSGAKPTSKSENAYLYRMVENLCISTGLPMPKLYIMEEVAINAFATGRDPKHASIAVTRGALEKLQNEELEGVLAHELSHIKNYDIRVMTIVVVLVGAIAILSNIFLRSNWITMHDGITFRNRSARNFFKGSEQNSEGGNVILPIIGIVLAILSPLIAQLIKLAVSRQREYLADASGALVTRFPEGLARALEKIAADKQPMIRATEATAHLYIANPFGNTRQWLTRVFGTHPPVEERVKRLRTMGV